MATRGKETFSTVESCAHDLDALDPLRAYRDRFAIPKKENGDSVHYFCGNSLGLLPLAARAHVETVLDDWANLGVYGHFDADPDWYSYHEIFSESGARLVGARPDEVVMMNSLTVNLHLMMVSFYRPTPSRNKILMESGAFPSDTYAIKSQIQHHGLDPAECLVTVAPRENEHLIRDEDIEQILEDHGESIALVLLPGVQFLTGQLFDMEAVTERAKAKGCVVGWDLAHAVGNVPLKLHEWKVDFAVWCSYKYLNSGPGAVGGCFVHHDHAVDKSLPRLAGWWGNDPSTRFGMHLIRDFDPRPTADGWQLSNPPILALAPLRPSLDLFDEAGMEALREKSRLLTGYLEFLIDELCADSIAIITSRDPTARGCQLSLVVRDDPDRTFAALRVAGVVCDFRKPDVIRVAPVPLYNRFRDVYQLVRVLSG